jgi:hypothetical protein
MPSERPRPRTRRYVPLLFRRRCSCLFWICENHSAPPAPRADSDSGRFPCVAYGDVRVIMAVAVSAGENVARFRFRGRVLDFDPLLHSSLDGPSDFLPDLFSLPCDRFLPVDSPLEPVNYPAGLNFRRARQTLSRGLVSQPAGQKLYVSDLLVRRAVTCHRSAFLLRPSSLLGVRRRRPSRAGPCISLF